MPLTSAPKLSAVLLTLGVIAVGVLLTVWWPVGTLVGLVVAPMAVLRIGAGMQRRVEAQRWAGATDVLAWFGVVAPVATPSAPPAPAGIVAAPAEPVLRDEVRAQLLGLKSALGDDYPDFARAARLVVATQYASASRLKRELHVPYSRARRLLTDLEQQHFVGPATGSLPRQVLMPKDRLPELEAALAA